jgi:hypothetical protein
MIDACRTMTYPAESDLHAHVSCNANDHRMHLHGRRQRAKPQTVAAGMAAPAMGIPLRRRVHEPVPPPRYTEHWRDDAVMRNRQGKPGLRSFERLLNATVKDDMCQVSSVKPTVHPPMNGISWCRRAFASRSPATRGALSPPGMGSCCRGA